MKWASVFALPCFVARASSTPTPVGKVVGLLKEMQAQVAKDAEADKEAYQKYECWCTTNRGLKTEAVDIAEKRIVQLEAFLEEAAGTQAQLKTEISALEGDIAEDQEALRTATALRESEHEEFRTSEADAKESIGALKEAVDVLAKVQLLQRSKGGHAQEIRPMLMQVREKLEGIHRRGGFQDVMRRDLWDVMGTIGDSAGPSDGEFLAKGNRRLSALGQQGVLSREAPPNDLQGNAAGASSYNARSGGIFGMISEMKDEFIKNLALQQKEEMGALISYQGLRAAKVGEIDSAVQSKDQKTQALADIQNKAAQAKEDVQATKDALGEDQQFLLGLEKNCKQNDDDFNERSKIRNEEVVAISEAITILTQDDARDLFGKTMSLLQVGSSSDTRQKAVKKAMQHILHVARKHKNWILASLAVRVRLDAFTRVQEAMDKMTAELKAQQQEEVEKKDYCNSNIDKTEDSITVAQHEKEDLESKGLGLENSIESLKGDLEALNKEVADMHVSLKRAGEDRKAENLVFQQSIADQRGTINVLEKARERLAQFYAEALMQVSKKQEPSNEPGAKVAPPPQKPAGYSKSGGSAGVLQMLEKIIQDAHSQEAELLTTEQHAQRGYEEMTRDSNDAVATYQGAILDKSKLLEEASAEKSETESDLLANGQELDKLGDTLKSYHVDCDFLLKYFGTRQQARTEELEAIAQAKAILSGADFGQES